VSKLVDPDLPSKIVHEKYTNSDVCQLKKRSQRIAAANLANPVTLE
jgi:hypothetical protein